MIERRIDDFYEAIRAQDVERIGGWFAPHARHRIYSATAGGSREFTGEYEGAAAIRARFADFRERWTITRLVVTDLAIEGERGAAQLEIVARATGGGATLTARTTHYLAFGGDVLVEFDVFIRELTIGRAAPPPLGPPDGVA